MLSATQHRFPRPHVEIPLDLLRFIPMTSETLFRKERFHVKRKQPLSFRSLFCLERSETRYKNRNEDRSKNNPFEDNFQESFGPRKQTHKHLLEVSSQPFSPRQFERAKRGASQHFHGIEESV